MIYIFIITIVIYKFNILYMLLIISYFKFSIEDLKYKHYNKYNGKNNEK